MRDKRGKPVIEIRNPHLHVDVARIQDPVGLRKVGHVRFPHEPSRDPGDPGRGLVGGEEDVKPPETQGDEGRQYTAQQHPERHPSREPGGRRGQQPVDGHLLHQLGVAGFGHDNGREAFDLVTELLEPTNLFEHKALSTAGVEKAKVDDRDLHAAASAADSDSLPRIQR